MSSCPVCGEGLERLTAFCPHCAAPLAHGAATATFASGGGPLRLRVSASGDFHRSLDGLEPGVLLGGRYRIVGLLGRGGMGEVYRADDLKLGQPVALKFLPSGLDGDPGRLDRFLSEVRMARQVSHPNVCRVYDVGEVDGRHFLSMEYVDGEDLSSLLRRIGRLPHDKALEIARQVCAGLAASHERGVIHRDLKPANVMLDGRGKARITDFGLAAVAGAGAGGEVAGTPAYMAPEQLAGGTISPQTDIYALGLLLFELFTGQRVHDVDTLVELRERHQRPASSVLSAGSADVDPAVLRVIERCLETEPGRRPRHPIAVAAALPGGDPLAAALAAGETPSPQMVAAAGDASAWTPKIAAWWAAAIIAGAALAVALNGQQVYHRFVPLPHSPEVLGAKADDLLTRLGRPPSTDSTSGFRMYPEFVPWVRATHPEVDPRAALPRLPVPMVTFWQQDSPLPILADVIGILGDGPARFVARAATPRTVPPRIGGIAGETLIELAPDGRLVRFQQAPPVSRPAPPSNQEPDWTQMFAWAGLDHARFHATDTSFVSTVSADLRRAWVMSSPEDPVMDALRVEAGTFAGTVAYFEVVAPWTLPERAAHPTSAPDGMLIVVLSIFGAVLIAAAGLAYRNVRLGRGDRRGTARFAASVGVATGIAGFCAAHVVVGIPTISILGGGAAFALYTAGITYMFYMALEPFVRRRWPQILVGWTRLLSGGWRDPVVGRELAVGTAFGLLAGSLTLLGPVLVERATGVWAPYFDVVSSVKWLALSTAFPAVYGGALAFASAPFYSLIGLFVLFILRVILRNEWAAAGAYVVVIFSMFIGAATHPLIQGPIDLVVQTIGVLVLIRCGFLAYTAMTVPLNLLTVLGLSLGGGVFYTGSMIAALVLLVGPGLFGVYTARGGGRLFGGILED
jgi:hypothetical protein